MFMNSVWNVPASLHIDWSRYNLNQFDEKYKYVFPFNLPHKMANGVNFHWNAWNYINFSKWWAGEIYAKKMKNVKLISDTSYLPIYFPVCNIAPSVVGVPIFVTLSLSLSLVCLVAFHSSYTRFEQTQNNFAPMGLTCIQCAQQHCLMPRIIFGQAAKDGY